MGRSGLYAQGRGAERGVPFQVCQAPDNIPFSVGLFGALPESRRLEHSALSAVQPRCHPLSALHEVRFRMSGG